jgi:hypothetical protein
MKSFFALFASLAFGGSAYCQNTFPASGNAGAGTTSPLSPLTVYNASGGSGVYGLTLATGFSGGNSYAINPFITGVSNGGFSIYDITNSAARLVIQQNTGSVGIGTTSPTAKLSVYGTFDGTLSGAEATYPGTIQIISTGQTSGGPDRVGGLEFKTTTSGLGYGHKIIATDLGNGETPLYFERRSNSASWTNTMTILGTNGNVGIGTTSPTEKLSVNGKIRAKEVIVETTGWSDYVFDENHKLQSLADVEQHIKTEKHLPGVPSAQEVAEKGVSVGDMQAILLAKIEELTLHQIAQEKYCIAQEKELGVLRAKISALEAERGQP